MTPLQNQHKVTDPSLALRGRSHAACRHTNSNTRIRGGTLGAPEPRQHLPRPRQLPFSLPPPPHRCVLPMGGLEERKSLRAGRTPPQRFAAERGALLKAEGGKKPEPGTQHGAPAAARQRLPHLTPRTNPAALRDPPGRGWRRGGNGERVGAPCGVGARFVAPTRRCPSGPAAPHGAQRSARDARCAFLRAPLRFWGAGRALFGVRFHFNFSGSGGGGGRRERGSHGRTPRNGYGEKPAPPPKKNIN